MAHVHTVTITVKHSMTWAELVQEADDAGVPPDARTSIHSTQSYGPVEPGVDELVFTW